MSKTAGGSYSVDALW